MTDVEITPAPVLLPIEVTVKRYDCAFCGSRYRRSKQFPVIAHMARCWSDPAKRTCRTCSHFMRGYTAGTPSAYEPPDAYEVDDECTLGELLPERAPVVGCPLWRNRDEEEDQPAEDAWDRSARTLTEGGTQ